MAERKVKQWITVNGVHVPIFEGQSKDEAVKKALSQFKDKTKESHGGSFEAELEEHSDPEYKNVTEGVKTEKQKEAIRAATEIAKVAMKYKMDAEELSKLAEGNPKKAEIIARNTSASVKKFYDNAGKQSDKYKAYNPDDDKYATKLKEGDTIKFEKDGKEYEAKITSLDEEVHRTLPNGRHIADSAYGVTLVNDKGETDYNIAGANKYKVTPNQIKGVASKSKQDVAEQISKDNDIKEKQIAQNKKDALQKASETIVSKESAEGLKKLTEKYHNKESQTQFSKDYEDKVSTYQNKFLKTKTAAQLNEIEQNINKAGNIVGFTADDHVALTAIRRERENRVGARTRMADADIDRHTEHTEREKTKKQSKLKGTGISESAVINRLKQSGLSTEEAQRRLNYMSVDQIKKLMGK